LNEVRLFGPTALNNVNAVVKSEKMVLRYAHMNVAHLVQSMAALAWGKSGKQGDRRSKMTGKSEP
jgi:hypothetical protein